MNYPNLLQNLPPQERETMSAMLHSLNNNSHVDGYQCKQAYNSLQLARKQFGSNVEKEITIKLFAKGENLDQRATDFLIYIEQNSLNWRSFNRTDDYPILVKLAEKLRNNYQNLPFYSQQFFAELDREPDFKNLINNIINSLSLPDEQIAELLQAQYSQNYDTQSTSYTRDELIRRIDSAGKLANLPKTAFERLLNYRVRQAKLSDANMALLKKCENNQHLTDAEKMRLHQQLAGEPQMIAALTQKACQLMQQQEASTHAEVKEFLKALKPVPLSSSINDAMPDYVTILNKIESNSSYRPSDDELRKLDQLHDALKYVGKLHILPNQSQAFLENYQTQQEIKQKLPSKPKLQELLSKTNTQQELNPMEAVYLQFYLNQHGHNIPERIRNNVLARLAKYPDLAAITRQQTELLDSKALKVINQVIEQIEREHRLLKDGIELREIGIKIKPTSQFMEIRFLDLKGLKKELRKVRKKEKLQEMIGTPDTNFWQNLTFRYHEGVDFTAHAKNDGTVTYQYGLGNIKGTSTGIQPMIAEVFAVELDTSSRKHEGRNAKVITIFEYHPDHGVLFTLFRHVQIAKVAVGDRLTINQPIGTYEISYQYLKAEEKLKRDNDKSKTIKEHMHIARKYADVTVIDKVTLDKLEAELNKSSKDPKAINEIQAELAQQAQFTQPIVQNNDYHTIALFIPGSVLNQKFLQEVEQKWRPYHNQLVKDGRFNVEGKKVEEKVSLIISYLEAGAIRDQFTLENLVTILLKLKSLWATVGEHNNSLESTLQYAQRVAIDLREKRIPDQFKILH